MKQILITLLILNYQFVLGQIQFIEIGIGGKYDVFKIKQTESTFKRNLDLGALAFISYGRPINKTLLWEAGLASNNYKLNFSVKGKDGEIYSNRELVSVMRSNRLFFNVLHNTKTIHSKLSFISSFGISMLIGAKNPYDVTLERSKDIETGQGTKSVHLKIKTLGLTGSAILIGASSRLYYTVHQDIQAVLNLGFITGLSKLSEVNIDYIIDDNTSYKKAVFTTNGFAPMLTLGIRYKFGEDE
jgi:hypothetical protein